MPGERLTLKEMCKKFDVTTRTLRYYEYIELLHPEKEGRTRFYGPTEFARMELILRGKRWGFSLEEIRQWLEMYSTTGPREQMVTFIEMSTRQIDELEIRRVQLDETIVELKQLRKNLKAELSKQTGVTAD